MNTNELADELKWLYENLEVHTSMLEAATMLRQLQAEIDALKKELYFKDYYEELPDTPVGLLENFKPVWQEKPELTLTNEEILQANLEFGKENGEDYSMLTIEDIEPLIGLVKFILRKASEK